MANTKYTPEQAAALVASDEPTFILRAKDALSVGLLREYKMLLLKKSVPDFEGSAKVRDLEKQFTDWQLSNLDKVQQPTL